MYDLSWIHVASMWSRRVPRVSPLACLAMLFLAALDCPLVCSPSLSDSLPDSPSVSWGTDPKDWPSDDEGGKPDEDVCTDSKDWPSDDEGGDSNDDVCMEPRDWPCNDERGQSDDDVRMEPWDWPSDDEGEKSSDYISTARKDWPSDDQGDDSGGSCCELIPEPHDGRDGSSGAGGGS